MSLFDRLFDNDPKKFFLAYDPTPTHWKAIHWNFDLAKITERKWTIEVQGDKTTTIEWFKDQKEEISFFENKRLLRKRRIPQQNREYFTLMNLAIHSTIKQGLEQHHEFMVTPVTGATTLDIQNETRALQWVQATFTTLNRALEKFETDPSLLVTAAFFSGNVPERDEKVVRLIAFNLDIFFYLQPDQSLQVVVYNDKDQGFGESKTPSFQQIIKVTKPQFYDEMVKLVHRIALVGEVK